MLLQEQDQASKRAQAVTTRMFRSHFQAQEAGKDLVISLVGSPRDFAGSDPDLASVCRVFPGPYAAVRIDLKNCATISSGLAARLLRLRDFYRERGSARFAIVHANARVLELLALLRLDRFFEVVP